MKKKLLLLLLLCLTSTIESIKISSLKYIRNGYFYDLDEKEATFFAFKKYVIFNDNMLLEDIEPMILNWFKESPTLHKYINKNYVSEKEYDHEQGDDDENFNIDDYKHLDIDDEFLDQLVDEKHGPSINVTNFEEFIKQTEEHEYCVIAEKLYHLNIIEQNLAAHVFRYIYKTTYLDDFVIMLHAFTHYHSMLTPAQAKRCQEVIKVLKSVGIVQHLSDECIDLLAQRIKTYCSLFENKKKMYNFDLEYTAIEIVQIEIGLVKEQIMILQKLLAMYE